MWCDIGTAFYILINPTDSGQSIGTSAKTYKSLIEQAVSTAAQSLGANENSSIPTNSGSSVVTFQGAADNHITVTDLGGNNLTYYQLSLSLNLTNGFMSTNSYSSAAVQMTNGTNNLGRIEII